MLFFFSILFLCFASNADIIIKGNKVVPAEKIQSMVDHIFDLDEAQETLHASGLFENTRIYKDGANYVVEVEEKRIVSNIIFVVDGDKKQKNDIGPSYETLIQVTGLKPGTIIDSQRILLAKTNIQSYYRVQNYEFARIRHEIRQRSEDAKEGVEAGFDLYIHVELGPKYEIDNVKFIGLKELPAEAMKRYITPRIKSYILFATSSPEPFMLQHDFESLVGYANDEGFLHAKVNHAFVETTLGETNVLKQRIYVSFDEGPICTIGNVSFKIDDTLHECKLYYTLSGIAKQYLIDEYAGYVLREYRSDGQHVAVSYSKRYRCANCPNKEEKKECVSCKKDIVDIEFEIQPVTNKHVVSKILVKGNSVTKTGVILRASKLTAGSYFDHRKLYVVENRIMNLGFFKFVNVQYYPDKEPGAYIVVIYLEDQASGQIGMQGSLMIGNDWDFSAGIFYQHPNFLGTGNEAMFNVTLGQSGESFNFGYKSNTLFDREIGWFINLYRTSTSKKQSEIDSSRIAKEHIAHRKNHKKDKTLKDNIKSVGYSMNLVGFTKGFSFDLYSYGAMSASFGIENQKVLSTGFVDEENRSRFFDDDHFPYKRNLFEVSLNHGIGKSYHKKQNIRLSTGLGWFYDGSSNFIKFTPKLKLHYPFNRSQSVYLTGTLSYGFMHVLSEKYYWLDHFESSEVYLKGLKNIGPAERNRYTQIGGTNKFNAYAELIMPFILPISQLNSFIGIYVGSLWGTKMPIKNVLPQYAKHRDWKLDTSDIASLDFNLRASVAAGLRFNLGIVKLELAFSAPLSYDEETDEAKFFQFNLTL